MTNPNNAIGTNGAFGGRTSVNAFNDVMGGLSRGILSGWACVPNSGLTVSLGGNGTTRDVAIAMDNAGNKTSINNISNSPVNVTIGSAPGTNSRIDAIVAYVDNPPSVSVESTDNPSICGLIVVQGTTASSPVNPTEAQIRTAITADGGSGTTAYYVILAYIRMASGTTDITSNLITSGAYSQLGTAQIENNSITPDKLNFTSLIFNKEDVDFTWQYRQTYVDQLTGFRLHLGGNMYLIGVNATSTTVIASSGGLYDLILKMPSGTTKVLGYGFYASWNGQTDSAVRYSRMESNDSLTCYMYTPLASDGSAVNFLGIVEMSS